MQLKRWNINLRKNESVLNNYTDIINDFIEYMSCNEIHAYIDLTTNNNTFIENFLQNMAIFHIKRLKLDINNVCATCWTTMTEYRLNYTHMHIDACDYEQSFFKTTNILPINTSITYFNENDTAPLLYTNLKKDHNIDHNILFNTNNNTLYIEFPEILKHISFDGGNYLHGEIYINPFKENIIPDKKKIVIALWYKDSSPLNIPTFDINYFAYYTWKKQNKTVDFLKSKDDTLLQLIPQTNNIKTIKITDNKIINYMFFENLIIHKKINAGYQLFQIIKHDISNYKSFILDISALIYMKPTPLIPEFINELEIWELTTNNNHTINEITENNLPYNNEFILDLTENKYSALEKYIYDISTFHLKRCGCSLHNINNRVGITYFMFNNDIDKYPPNNITNSISMLTIHLNYTKNEDKTLLTNLNVSDINYDSLHTINNTMYISNNNIYKHSIYNNKYYNNYSNDSIIINIWNKPLEINSIQPIQINKIYDKLINPFTFNRIQSIPDTIKINKNTMLAILKDPNNLNQSHNISNNSNNLILKLNIDESSKLGKCSCNNTFIPKSLRFDM